MPTASRLARVNYWPRLAVRWLLCACFLMYAAAKFVGTQFITSGSTLDKPVGELSGFELTWVYFGYSTLFAYFVAGGQATAAVLLAFDRTARLGAAVLLPIVVNIVVVNYGFNISAGTKRLSLVLLGLTLYLVACDLSAWKRVLWDDTAADPARPRWLGWRGWGVARAVLVLLLAGGAWSMLSGLKQQYMAETSLTGDWVVDEATAGGDLTGWRKVWFEPGDRLTVRTERGVCHGRYEVGPADGTLTLKLHPTPAPAFDADEAARAREEPATTTEEVDRLMAEAAAHKYPVELAGRYERVGGRLVVTADRNGERLRWVLRPYRWPKF